VKKRITNGLDRGRRRGKMEQHRQKNRQLVGVARSIWRGVAKVFE
jgi:hypothetical protein